MTGGLEVRQLAVGVDGQRLLSGLHLALGPGETVAVLGPSGCGKTTLLRAIAALEDPLDGDVRLDGRTPADIGWPEWRRRVVLVSQRPVWLTGTLRANLERPFDYLSVGGHYPVQRAAAWLSRLGLDSDRLDQDARTLSEGEAQRAALVRALLLGPRVLLLDEPTSALDEDAARSVVELLRERATEDGLAALVVTHDRAAATHWCDRVIELAGFGAAVAAVGEGPSDA